MFGINFGIRGGQEIVVTGQGYSGKRKVTSSTLRALSAVGVLKQTGQGVIQLEAYHNPVASIPIESAELDIVHHNEIETEEQTKIV